MARERLRWRSSADSHTFAVPERVLSHTRCRPPSSTVAFFARFRTRWHERMASGHRPGLNGRTKTPPSILIDVGWRRVCGGLTGWLTTVHLNVLGQSQHSRRAALLILFLKNSFFFFVRRKSFSFSKVTSAALFVPVCPRIPGRQHKRYNLAYGRHMRLWYPWSYSLDTPL